MNNVNYQKKLFEIIEKVKDLPQKPTLLLHACCGPCFTIPYEEIKDYFDITIIYNNSNIYSQEEHDRRLSELKRYIKEIGATIKFIEFPYDGESFVEDLKPYCDQKEGQDRCRLCFGKRLEEGYRYAFEHHFDYYGTIMTISRYKNAQDINRIGLELEKKYPTTKWLCADFKKNNGYERSLEIIREHGLYFQEFCGCIFSYTVWKNKH